MKRLTNSHPDGDCSGKSRKSVRTSPFWIALFGAGTVAAALVVPAAAADDVAAPSVGRSLANFTLQDFRGKSWSLDDFRDKKAVAIAFVGVECPLVQHYASRLQELAGKYEAA